MMTKLLLLSVLSGIVLGKTPPMPCRKQFDVPKATFDLSALYQEKGRYLANDTFMLAKDLSRPYTYFFNVCGDVDEPDEVAMCHQNFSGTTSAAYQRVKGTDVNGNKDECWALGRAESPEWTYIPGDNAAVGVQLKYTGGGKCRDSPGKDRSFVIEFACIHEATALPAISTVYEDDFCEYKVTMESIYGCPLECHSGDHDKVCSGHGICAVDTGTRVSRCFCNEGRTGDDCMTETTDGLDQPPSSYSPTGVLVALTIILLLGLIVLAGVLHLKIKKLNADENPYGAFEDQMPMSARD